MKSFIFAVKLLLVALTLSFIWGNSLRDAEASLQQSDRVLELVEPVVDVIQQDFSQMGYDVSKTIIVRKAAHFTEFALLGAVMFLLFVKPDGRSRYLPPALLCLASAFVDEGIQIFSVDRGPSLRDVGLDFSGACTGIVMCALVVLVLYSLGRGARRSRGG